MLNKLGLDAMLSEQNLIERPSQHGCSGRVSDLAMLSARSSTSTSTSSRSTAMPSLAMRSGLRLAPTGVLSWVEREVQDADVR